VNTSLFEIFKIGIGPSSSHTVGAMRAAAEFVGDLRSGGFVLEVRRVQIDLCGSESLCQRGGRHSIRWR
jgi:L-serine dehydratase